VLIGSRWNDPNPAASGITTLSGLTNTGFDWFENARFPLFINTSIGKTLIG
jgi:hypothetical protein